MTATPSTLIFVDATVDNYQSLIQGATPNAEVIVLDPNQDGIQQISQILSAHHNLQSIQIVSHGSSGRLSLGTAELRADNIEQYAAQIQQWKTCLAEGADLLLYGCEVAAGEEGKAFVQRISQLSGADVAASDDLTGNAQNGGDWALEVATGEIEAPLAFQVAALNSYSGVLKNYNVSTFAQLKDAINESQTTPEDDVVNFTNNINLTEELPAITSNIAFVGNSYTVSGSNTYRGFTVNGGTVSFSNLTIANGKALGLVGTDGTTQPGTDGGFGRGGGLLINNGAVSLVNTNFIGNQAIGGKGGSSLSGIGGNGGYGEGGAVYINAGSLRISTSTFSNNAAIAGEGGTGGTNGSRGLGKGGALYVNAGATVISERTPALNGNTATNAGGTDTDNVNVFGTLTVVIPPITNAITRLQPELTADANVSYTITFDQDVTGVDATDFSLLATGNITGAGIVSVSPVANNNKAYTVLVNTGSGNGTLRVDLKDNDSILNAGGAPLGSTGVGNGDFAGETYTINKTPPAVFSIARKNPNPTAAAALTYTVVFTQDVSGVDVADFALAPTATITGASITSITPINGKTYDVLVNTGSGNGDLGLNLIDDDSIKNTLGVVLGGSGVNNGNAIGQTYTIDKTPPTIATIALTDPSPTKAATASYTVTFSQPVAGVDVGDFKLSAVGVTGASITSVTPIDGRTYTVLVNTGNGDGSLRLDAADNDSILNGLGVPLGGTGIGNGNFNTGPAYTLLKSNPVVSAIALVNPNPTASNTVNYTVTFNQDVSGVDIADFALASTGVAGAGITAVTGSGKTYNVAARTGNGSGTLGLNLVDNDSIVNVVNTPLGGTGSGNGNALGRTYTVNKVPPRVGSITRLDTNPTNSATANFAVIFNENVIQVDANDFALTTQGVTGARITSITRVNGSFYTVTVGTGSGNGSIGLNLVDNDSILNTLGVALGGVGAGNGNFAGEVYGIDKAAPTVNIIDVAPDPRRDKVDSITLRFSEAVSGFDLSDLRLTRGNTSVALRGATLASTDGINWTVGNLRKLTNERGDYTLTLTAGESGIRDAAGNVLSGNASDRWTNLVTVDACLPGITRKGTRRADTLQGTDDSDTLQGLDGNDTLIGLDCKDRLIGDNGNDRLLGGNANDTLLGGANNDILDGGTGADLLDGGLGADRFVYAGNNQAEALSNSLVSAPDRIRSFKFSQGDKIQLDFDNNLRRSDRPRGLFQAGRVAGRNLRSAAQSAFRDKNQVSSGAQTLQGNEAVFFSWGSRTYLAVNDGTRGFSTSRDLIIDMSGLVYKSGDAAAGVLSVSSYFS